MDWRILVVDDEAGICTTLRNYLSFSGYDVVTAGSGPEALEIASSRKIHVALLDIKMSPMDGLTLLEKLHEHDFSIQVIMMTGYSTFDLTIQALEKGAADYILKPFDDMEEMVRLIEIATDRLTRWRRILADTARKQRDDGEATGD